MSSSASFETQLMRLGEKNNVEALQKLVGKTSAKALTTALSDKLGGSDCVSFWNFLLLGFDAASHEAREKRFACVKSFLEGLLKIELSFRHSYDLITRLCQDLPSFPSVQLVEILENCLEGIRVGDPKCVGWKDLLPEALNLLAATPQLNVNGVTMAGGEYRDATIRNLCTMRWPTEILTPLADLFKSLPLNNAEVALVLNKFSSALQGLSPAELPALAYQLFSMCGTAAQIVLPIFALEKYFHHYYYKKLFADMNSNTTDFDSIDAYSDKELREAEETILHHLNYCTQYKISELQMSLVLRNFVSMPDVVLTPFVLSCVLSMTAANRDPESARLSTSILLPVLRTVIKNNEHERSIAEDSVWCRDSLQRKQVDLEQVFTVLIDQNKEGKDVITPGLVNLAFVLLKAKGCGELHQLAMNFLTKFIRKRFVFGQGIVKKLAEWLVVEQDQPQYSECLTLLSIADTFTVSECFKTITYVMDFFLWIPGEQAMRMMSFILPVLKLSAKVRDAFIEVLRKAINSSEMKTRRMAVYGFCMILKQLNNSNAQRSQLGASFCTQHTISGFSLMSQATLGNRANPQRHFDMLTLEIIGVLRNCLNQSLEIKCTLYEYLQRAVELNPKLAPHVLQFIDWHFRSFFTLPSTEEAIVEDFNAEVKEFAVLFERLVYEVGVDQPQDIVVSDNLGKLILFVSHCLTIFETYEGDYDTREMRRTLDMSVEKVVLKECKFAEIGGSLTPLKSETGAQHLSFLEGLMAYALLHSQPSNASVKQILPLFRLHQKTSEALKSLSVKKAPKKAGKSGNDTTDQTGQNLTINGVAVKKLCFGADNIWDLPVVEKLLRLLHEDIVPFAAAEHTTALRSCVELVRYVFEVAILKVRGIRLEPQYKQIAQSKRTLKNLTDITKIVYERCVKRLPSLWKDFDVRAAALAAELFQQCLQTANEVYKSKFTEVFLKGFDFHYVNGSLEAPAVLHDVIDAFFAEERDATNANETLSKDADGRRIPGVLLLALESLYANISFGNRMTTESYKWLLKFCKDNELHSKDLSYAHKLLFTQRQKTHSGAFFHSIAFRLGQVLEVHSDASEDDPEAQLSHELKSITAESSGTALNFLYGTLQKQIEEVEYFVLKANNLNYKCRTVPEDDRDFSYASLRSLERAISSQLAHIANALLKLTNVCIPLGPPMDALLRLLMQYYTCLKNLGKHFLQCCATGKVAIASTKFDLLVRAIGKPLPTNIYTLITYIEANILDEGSHAPGVGGKRTKPNPQAQKAKILRETKLIPKIILCIENFNKHVILLAKRTDDRLANLLHLGNVRDFRIKTADLKAAIDRTLSHSSQIEVDESGGQDGQQDVEEDETEKEDEANEDSEGPSPLPEDNEKENEKTKRKRRDKEKAAVLKSLELEAAEVTPSIFGTASTPDNESVVENESMETSTTQVMKNLGKINKRARKRSLKAAEAESHDPDVATAPPPEPKRRRGRSSKK